MGGEEAEPKAVRHPVLTRRSIVTGKEFLDFGRITAARPDGGRR